jgi:hypothetical protein
MVFVDGFRAASAREPPLIKSPAMMNVDNAQLVNRGMIAALSDYTGSERCVPLKIG